MKKFKDYRKESREVWGRNIDEEEEEEGLLTEQIQLGAILRIADSLENIEELLIKNKKYAK